jgi:hypothetical protein
LRCSPLIRRKHLFQVLRLGMRNRNVRKFVVNLVMARLTSSLLHVFFLIRLNTHVWL